MLPSAPQTTSGDSHVMSHDSDSALSTLSTALRLSIAGETLDQDTTELQPSISDMVNHKEPALVVPDDVPVDLRVKLAVSMIQLGKTIPEVRLNYNSIAVPSLHVYNIRIQDLLQPIFVSAEDYGDLYLDIADAYMENSEFLTDHA